MNLLTRKQIALVHVACKELGINKDDRHNIQEEFTGFRSLTKMNYQAWCRLIRHLEERGFKTAIRLEKNAEPGTPNSKRKLITKIYALWYSLAGTYYNPGAEKKALRGFLRKRFRVEHENFLSTEQAIKVIEAIKAISRREHSAKGKENGA